MVARIARKDCVSFLHVSFVEKQDSSRRQRSQSTLSVREYGDIKKLATLNMLKQVLLKLSTSEESLSHLVPFSPLSNGSEVLPQQ